MVTTRSVGVAVVSVVVGCRGIGEGSRVAVGITVEVATGPGGGVTVFLRTCADRGLGMAGPLRLVPLWVYGKVSAEELSFQLVFRRPARQLPYELCIPLTFE